MSSVSDIVRKAKERGDKFYHERYYKPAAAEYSICIQNTSQSDSELIIYHSNRCACYLQLNRLQEALEDANTCIRINPRWVKGYQRLGRCYERLQRFPEAIAAYEQALEIEPRNYDLTQAINNCRQFLNRESSSSSFRAEPSARFGNQAWHYLSATFQGGLTQLLMWWSSLSSEIKWLYGGSVLLFLYLWMSRRGRDYTSQYYEPSYDYYYEGYYPSGGISISTLALILGAGKFNGQFRIRNIP